MGNVENPLSTLNTPESLRAIETGWFRQSSHWCERYRDPGLNTLIDQALSQSLEIRLAQVRVSQAAALADQAGAEREPKVDGNDHVSRTPGVVGLWARRFRFGR